MSVFPPLALVRRNFGRCGLMRSWFPFGVFYIKPLVCTSWPRVFIEQGLCVEQGIKTKLNLFLSSGR